MSSKLGMSTVSVKIKSETGEIHASNVLQMDGHDFAEYFPNLRRGIIGDGVIVTEFAGKVVPATRSNDDIIGTVTKTPCIVGDGADMHWHDKFLTDDFGRRITTPRRYVKFDYTVNGLRLTYDGPLDTCKITLPPGVRSYMVDEPKLNPAYSGIDYVPRSERPEEYSLISIVGQVYVRVSENIESRLYIDPLGRGTKRRTRLKMMTMTTPYSKEKGYGVAKALLERPQ